MDAPTLLSLRGIYRELRKSEQKRTCLRVLRGKLSVSDGLIFEDAPRYSNRVDDPTHPELPPPEADHHRVPVALGKLYSSNQDPVLFISGDFSVHYTEIQTGSSRRMDAYLRSINYSYNTKEVLF
ncbi:Protein of unknown function, partial [Gryllus bimaculatus]